MTNKKELTDEQRLSRILGAIKTVAIQEEIHPSQVTAAQIYKTVEGISNWDVTKLGGLPAIKSSYFPMTEKDLVHIRRQQSTNKYLKELERKLGDKQLLKDQTLKDIEAALGKIKFNKPRAKIKAPKRNPKKKSMTMELMVSDIHIGKLTDTFNLDVARSRLAELRRVFLEEHARESESFNVDKVILALIGDLVESSSMHGMESSKGCEFGNSEQMRWAIELLFDELIEPLALLGIAIDIPCVTGNHDRVEREKTMNKPGKHYMSWVVYHTLRMLAAAKGLTNLNFIIPEGSNCILSVYGNNILYEHGDNLKGTERRSLDRLLASRSTQFGKVLHMMRSGHWHEYLCLGRGKYIINESLCGQDEYAAIMGFDSHAGQTINFYVETNSRPTCFYKSFPVYLG